ncbi:MAG: acetolactate synthase small subunit [Akkermansiaceae bacterium]|nr:acetolactate synthase small subunit [Akkermansiaceae bacterium]
MAFSAGGKAARSSAALSVRSEAMNARNAAMAECFMRNALSACVGLRVKQDHDHDKGTASLATPPWCQRLQFVWEIERSDSVTKEMVLIKIQCSPEERSMALQIAEHFAGKTVDLTPTSMIVMINGDSPKVDAAIAMFSQFNIIETVRTGKVVMARGEQPTCDRVR